MSNRQQRRAAAAKQRKRGPGYLDKAMLEAAQLFRQMGEQPFVGHVIVQHDDWCDLLNGRGECNCNPDVFARPDRVS